MKPKERKQFFKENHEKLTAPQMAEVLGVQPQTIRKYEQEFGACKAEHEREAEPKEILFAERKARKLTESDKANKKKIRVLADENDKLAKELEAIMFLKENIASYNIPLRQSKKDSSATAVALISDWHIEERVKPDHISFLNEYTVAIARTRAESVFVNVLKLLEKERTTVGISELVVYLLGDYISNDIHDELMENTELLPIDAIIEAQRLLVSGLDYLLKHSKCTLTVVCHSGNHARTTQKTRHATEAGHSLEYFMYSNLSEHYRKDKRIHFVIPRGYHAYTDINGFVIRSHHGHALKYGGGVGGIFIPTYKSIAQWNKGKPADLDVFGHFHQRKDGGNFLCNGSVIGYNEYALSIKADYELPAQTFFLVDHKRKLKTNVSPIFCD